MRTLRQRYADICDEYIKAFMRKHGFFDDETGEYSECYWIADDVGGIAQINDYSIGFDDIRRDIDECVPKDVYFEFYDYAVEHDTKINYESYLKGFRL